MRINDLLLGLVIALLGAITIWASHDFSSLPRQQYGAGTFPTLIGSMLIITGGLMVLRAKRYRSALFTWKSNIVPTRVLLCAVVIIVAVVGYIILTPILGFPIVSLVMLTLLIGWLTSGRWLLAGIVSIAATALIWLAFAELLHVPLALGVLEKVVY